MQRLGILLMILIESCVAQNSCGRVRPACSNAGGYCQSKKDNCAGELLRDGRKYCSSRKCGCCILPPENKLPDCSAGKLWPCAALNGTCISLVETCDGREITDKIFCNNAETCKCCIPETPCGCYFNGAFYQPGSYIQNTCARLVCNDTTGHFNFIGYDQNCPLCKAYLDPHIVTYDSSNHRWSSYSYQGCGNYSLTQLGATFIPTLAVFATFTPCGGNPQVTCVDTLTFKNDEHTVITIGFNIISNTYEIDVNGELYTISSSTPSIVHVNGIDYPVLAWQSWNSVTLQGSSGILVRFYGLSRANQVYIWSDLRVAKGLLGLCGTANDNIDDDFTCRNGTVLSPWQSYPPEEFTLSWKTGDCVERNARVKRQVQNRCEADPSIQRKIKYQCILEVTGGFFKAKPGEVPAMFDDCLYDLCNVSNPDDWIKAVIVAAEIQADIRRNTLSCEEEIKCDRPVAMVLGLFTTGRCREVCHSDEVVYDRCDIHNQDSCLCCLKMDGS